jgi:hypothetical protein
MKDTSALAASARDVTFADFGHDLDDQVDAITSPEAAPTIMQLLPRTASP